MNEYGGRLCLSAGISETVWAHFVLTGCLCTVSQRDISFKITLLLNLPFQTLQEKTKSALLALEMCIKRLSRNVHTMHYITAFALTCELRGHSLDHTVPGLQDKVGNTMSHRVCWETLDFESCSTQHKSPTERELQKKTAAVMFLLRPVQQMLEEGTLLYGFFLFFSPDKADLTYEKKL